MLVTATGLKWSVDEENSEVIDLWNIFKMVSNGANCL
jgi:hypothetical protein